MTHRSAHMRSRLRFAAVIAAVGLALMLALSGCSTTSPTPNPTVQALTSETPVAPITANNASAEPLATPEPVIPVPAQLQFTSATVDGRAFSGSDLAGKNTVLWFWAPWCPVCQAESGTVVEALAQLPDGVTLVGVAGRADASSMQAFIDTYGVDDFEHIADVDGAVWAGFGITYQPAFAFIGEDGSVRTVPSVMSTAEIVAGANELVS